MTAQTRNILIGTIVVGILAGAFIFYRTNISGTACKDVVPKPTIIALGDSLVAGYGAPEGQDFVTGLSSQIGVPITNLGVSGDTTAQGLARASEIEESPDIAIILLGGNDALRKVPLEQTKSNLGKIIEKFQADKTKNTRVILIGVLGGFPIDPYSGMFKDLAKQYDVTYVPNILSGLFGRSGFMSEDGIHPNAAGYAKIADRLYPVVEEECGGAL